MSATDELRRLLDERGVEYYKHEDGEPLRELHEGRDDATSWRVGGANVCAVPFDDYTFDLWIDHATPEQAIDATLGRGTCKLDFTAYTKGGVDFAGFRCDGCGFTQAVPSGDLWGVTRFWSYCPNCGKRVVE